MRALDADTGQGVWETSYAGAVQHEPGDRAHGPGPKSTPTFADGRLFTLGISGIVTAFDARPARFCGRSRGADRAAVPHVACRRWSIAAWSILHVGGDKRAR